MKLRISRRTDLALRALRELHSHNATLQAGDLAELLQSTPNYMPQVLRPFIKAGWISGRSGPTGGYRLEVDLNDQSILDLIELSEGPTDTGECVLTGGPCEGENSCSLHLPWQDARAALLDRLAATPITDSSNKEQEK